MADIVLIASRFEVSMSYALPFLRAKAVSPPASLLLPGGAHSAEAPRDAH
jgi:hypothetical protein